MHLIAICLNITFVVFQMASVLLRSSSSRSDKLHYLQSAQRCSNCAFFLLQSLSLIEQSNSLKTHYRYETINLMNLNCNMHNKRLIEKFHSLLIT